ncbi:hypothetical protein ACFU8W_09550 [Streptomyces sp. NPDC057565]|uniref:hypothetical protein n=1 Tax=Streptomyces sp. NPDC057565 TaxID=3346169 RepID=UPI00367EE908
MDGENPEAEDGAGTRGPVPARRAALAQELLQTLGTRRPGFPAGPGGSHAAPARP